MPTQKDRILQLLGDRGELGVLNIELNESALRYSARLANLRADGYRNRTTRLKNATWRFTLLSDDDKPTELAAELGEPQYMQFGAAPGFVDSLT